MYNKVETNMNFVEREKEVVEYWNEKKIFDKNEGEYVDFEEIKE